MKAAVLGVGLWMPGSPDVATWRAGVTVAGAGAPPSRLPPRLQRRASLLIGMVAEVATQATAQAGLSLAETQLPVVVGSAFGELATTMAILRELEGDGEGIVSPTRFQSSVHNSAVGYLSIAHGNQAAGSSIAAGNDTVAMVLAEAMTLLACQGGLVLAIVGDEALPAALRPAGSSSPLAAALVLADLRAETPRPPLAVLGDLRADARGAAVSEEVDAPCTAILPLLDGILSIVEGRAERVIALAPALAAPRWSVSVRSSSPPESAP